MIQMSLFKDRVIIKLRILKFPVVMLNCWAQSSSQIGKPWVVFHTQAQCELGNVDFGKLRWDLNLRSSACEAIGPIATTVF